MTNKNHWTGITVKPLVLRLKKYNKWRRGAEISQPDLTQLGKDIDIAIELLNKMSMAIELTLGNNLHLADGDDCTLIELVNVAKNNKGGNS